MKRVAYYIRVSSEQQEKEQTKESQIAELEAIIKRDKNKLVKKYVDNGYSGETMKRPALTELRESLSRKLFEILYVTNLDRFNRDKLNQLLLLKELKENDIEIVCGGKPLNTDENKTLIRFESSMAQHQKERIGEDSKRGKLYWANNGKSMNTKAPYGYDYILKEDNKTGNKTGKFKINPEEAKVVKLIAKLYLKCKSPLKVGRELTRRNISAKQGGRWTPTRVRVLLHNEAYIGKMYYNKHYKVEPKTKRTKFTRRSATSKRLRDRKYWVNQKIPAILDENIFYAIQKLLKKNYKLFGVAKRFYLLSGILCCAKCGSKMNGETKDRGESGIYHYYRCHNKELRHPLPPTCNVRSVRTEKVDRIVWDTVRNALQDPDFLKRLLFNYDDKDKDKKLLLNEKDSLLRQKEKIKQEKDKLFDLYGSENSDKIDRKILEGRIGKHIQTEREINNLLKEIEIRLKQIANKNIVIKNLKKFCQLNKIQLTHLIPQQKRNLLKVVIKEITWNFDTQEIDLIGEIPIFTTLRGF